MSLLTVVQDVCAVVGVMRPTAVTTAVNTDRTMFEMLACANEMAQRIASNTRDWTALQRLYQFGGGTGAFGGDPFALPSDFKRFLLPANMWRSTNTQQPMRFIPDTDEWYQRRFGNYSSSAGEWTKSGGQLLTWPSFSGTQRILYLDKNCVRLAAGGLGDRFTADDDAFRLDERLLRLGMIWSWKQSKGSPYAEDMGTYQDAIAWEMGTDSPAPIIIGCAPLSTAARIAYPWPVPTP